MFIYITQQIILTAEKLGNFAAWFGPLALSITSLSIALRKNKKEDHEKQHQEITDHCETLIELMEKQIKSVEERSKERSDELKADFIREVQQIRATQREMYKILIALKPA